MCSSLLQGSSFDGFDPSSGLDGASWEVVLAFHVSEDGGVVSVEAEGNVLY